MIYRQAMAMAIKVNGRVLREDGETVYLPFGCEYSVLMKNMSHKKALVNLFLDDELVTEGGLVIDPNSSIDLERFLRGNMHTGNKFKFIERSSKIENHRGVGIADGIIRLEFGFDTTPYVAPHMRGMYPSPYNGYLQNTNEFLDSRPPTTGTPYPQNAVYTANSVTPDYHVATATSLTVSTGTEAKCQDGNKPKSSMLRNVQTKNEAGITVEGSKSTQQFVYVPDFPTGEKQSLILRLLGDVNQQKVTQPVTVKRKLKCKTCGTVNIGTAKFCRECSAGLIKY